MSRCMWPETKIRTYHDDNLASDQHRIHSIQQKRIRIEGRKNLGDASGRSDQAVYVLGCEPRL